jgi:hypothetical protein
VLVLGADWATISSLATAGGTLVLAVATFASVRSANRSTRIAEEALQEQRLPVFAPSRFTDPAQKIMFVEGHFVGARGGHGAAQRENGSIYLVISLRNVGSGIGVCQGWVASAGLLSSGRRPDHRPLSEFRTQTRDLYIPAGDIGMWQGALRDPNDPWYEAVADAIETKQPITIELLYSDQVGAHQTITRFGLTPYADPESGEVGWIAGSSRHWFLDRPGPRSEEARAATAEAILRQVEAVAEGAHDRDEDGIPVPTDAGPEPGAPPRPNAAPDTAPESAATGR